MTGGMAMEALNNAGVSNANLLLILNDNKTLFFSSQGHETMGGFDIFRCELLEDNSWSQPTNIGFPLNTTSDNTVEMATPMMVTQWAPARPICLPNRPAIAEPISGARIMAR